MLPPLPDMPDQDLPARRAARAEIRAAFRAGRVAERLVANPYPERTAPHAAFNSGRDLERLLACTGNTGPAGVAPMTRAPTAAEIAAELRRSELAARGIVPHVGRDGRVTLEPPPG